MSNQNPTHPVEERFEKGQIAAYVYFTEGWVAAGGSNLPGGHAAFRKLWDAGRKRREAVAREKESSV